MRVLLLNGSPHKHGSTHTALSEMIKILEDDPPFHFPLLSFWPPLSPASFFSSLYNSVNISEWSSCGVLIRK